MAAARTARSGARTSPDEGEPSRLFLAASYAVMAIGGVVLAVFGAFMLPYSVSSAESAATPTGGGTASHLLASGSTGGVGQVISAGIAVALILNPALSWAGLRTAGTRLAALTPLATWIVVVLVLSSSRPTGSVVLSNNLRSIAFLLVGTLAFTAVAALGRPTRGATAAMGGLVSPPRTAPGAPRRR